MRRWAFAFVAVAVVAAAVVAFWPRGGGAPRGSEEAGGGEGPGDVPAPISGGEWAEKQDGPGLAAGTGPRSAAGAASGAARRGRSSIEGTVTRDARPCAATVTLLAVEDEDQPFRVSAMSRVQQVERDLRVPVLPTPVGTVTAGEDGRYRFAGYAEGAYWVRALATDGRTARVHAMVSVDGERVEADVALQEPGGPLKGRVVHADGTPWTGTVAVTARPSAPRNFFVSAEEAIAAAGEDGRFTVTGLEAGKWRVSAILVGTARITGEEITLPRAEEYVLTVDGPTRRLEGRVLDETSGAGVPAATILASPLQGPSATVKGTSEADGTFHLDLPGKSVEKASVTVCADGYAPWWRYQEDLAKPLEVRLARAASLEGRVVSAADGSPIEGASVSATSGRGGWIGSGTATSGSDGRYSMTGLAPGAYSVAATAKGWIGEESPSQAGPAAGDPGATVTIEAGKTATMDLRLRRGARATGHVLDPAGAPVVGALVSAEGQADDTDPWFGRVPAAYRARFLGLGSAPQAASAADGSFAIDGLVPGTAYVFSATAPGMVEARTGERVARLEAPLDVEIRFGETRALEVAVTDEATGAPVAGARVTVKRMPTGDEDEDDDVASAETSPEGHARLSPVPAAALRLFASHDDFLSSGETSVPEREGAASIRLRRGLEVSGKVLRPDGMPASDAQVRVRTTGAVTMFRGTQCESDGTFRVRGLPAGNCTLGAYASVDGRRAQGSAEVAAGTQGVVVPLVWQDAAKAGRVLVRVVDPDGKPVPAARVTAYLAHGSHSTYARDGRCSFDVGEAVVVIEASEPADSAQKPLPFGPARVEGVRPGPDEVVVRLPPELAISGVVRDEQGNPLAGAVVRAAPDDSKTGGYRPWDDDDDTPRGFYGWGGAPTPTGADGAFRVGRLAPGPHLVRAKPSGDFIRPDPVRASAGESGVVIVVRAGVGAVVKVVDPEAKPVRGARVVATVVQADSEDRVSFRRYWTPWTRTTDAEGTLRLSGLDPKREYALDVTPPESRGDLRPRSAERWVPRDETVRLEGGWRLRGIVRDGTGKPVPGCMVERRDEDGSWEHDEHTDEAGRFTFSALPLGDVVLRARMGWGGGQRTGPEVTVAAKTPEVVLTFDPGATLTVVIDGWPQGADGNAVAVAEGRLVESGAAWGSVDDKGRATFEGLDPAGTYSVFVKPESSDLYAWRTGLRPGLEPLRVALVAGATITVRVKAPAGAADVYVGAAVHGASIGGDPAGEGRWIVRGVPEGTWTVHAWAEIGDAGYQASAEAASGSTVDLELKPATR